MRDFRELKVWEKAHGVAVAVYKLSVGFPRTELYGLTNQMRRCSVSVAANIAEGCGRNSKAELARFLQIAMGSASELEYCLLLARDLEFLKAPDHGRVAKEVTEVKRMLTALIKAVSQGRG